MAVITPVFKKGDKDSPTNYRPISLVYICSKLMEHIVTSFMMSNLDEYNIRHHLRYGLRQGRSCETQLLELTTNLLSNLVSGNQTLLKLSTKYNVRNCYWSLTATELEATHVRGLKAFSAIDSNALQ